MRGIFKPRYLLWIYCLFMMGTGSFIGIRFGVWGIDAIVRGEGMAIAVFSLLFAVFGLIFGCLSIVVFNFNRFAYLEVDDYHLRSSFGWGKKISISLNDIVDAYAKGHYLTLWTKQKVCHISGLINAVAIGEYILSRIPSVVWIKDPEEESEKLRSEKKKYYVFLCATVMCAAAMFANIGWGVLLTGGKALSEFTRHDDVVFLMFIFIEIITVIGAFLFASRCGISMQRKNHHAFTLLAVNAFENRKNGLERYHAILSVWYFESATQRIVIYHSNDGYSYMLESYALDKGWCAAYPASCTFETYQELDKDISFRFSDVILEQLP